MKTVYKLAIAVFSIALITSCGDDEFESPAKNEVSIDLGGEVVQSCTGCLITDENNPSNAYGRIDSVSKYGHGMYYALPDSLKDCGLKLILSGKIRETEYPTGYIAIAVHSVDSIYFWGHLFTSQYVKESNKWIDFKDSVNIPKSANTSASRTLKVFQFKEKGRGYFDLDNLNVKIIRQ